MNPYLGNAFADRFAIAKISCFRLLNAAQDQCLARAIFQSIQPNVENIGFEQCIHSTNCIPEDT